MSRKNNFGQTGRNAFGTSHGAGKGDVDRSPGWRDHYDEVEWPKSEEGFVKRGGKLVKRYGAEKEPEKFDKAPNIKV